MMDDQLELEISESDRKSEKPSWVSASMQVILKNPPEKFLGVRMETWVFAKRKPVSLGTLLVLVTKRLIEFYINAMPLPVEKLQEQIDAYKEFVDSITIHGIATGDPGETPE